MRRRRNAAWASRSSARSARQRAVSSSRVAGAGQALLDEPPRERQIVAAHGDEGGLVAVLRVVAREELAQHGEPLVPAPGAAEQLRPAAAGERRALGHEAVEDRDEAPLDRGRLGVALGHQEVGHLVLEGVDLLLGQLRPTGVPGGPTQPRWTS